MAPDTPIVRRPTSIFEWSTSHYRALFRRVRHLDIDIGPILSDIEGPARPRTKAHMCSHGDPITPFTLATFDCHYPVLLRILRPTTALPPQLSLSNLGVAELRARVRRFGINMCGRRSKAAYIIALEAHEQEPGADAFRLMDLPTELRNMVYKLVVCEPTPVCTIDEGLCSQPALTQVCKQLREEALPIFYGKNRFAMGCLVRGDRRAVLCEESRCFLRAVEKWLGLIHSWRIEVEIVLKLIYVDVDTGPRKSEEHLVMGRTCAYHMPGSTQCGRWREGEDHRVEEVFGPVPLRRTRKGQAAAHGREWSDAELDGGKEMVKTIEGIVDDERRIDTCKGVELDWDSVAVANFAGAIGELIYKNKGEIL